MLMILQIMTCIMLSAVAIAFIWALAELTIETIKERKHGRH